jgi:hypothetical protein
LKWNVNDFSFDSAGVICFQVAGSKSDIDHNWSLYGKNLWNIENGKFAVTLNRAAICKTVIPMVLQPTAFYGSVSPTVGANHVMINCVRELTRPSDQAVGQTLSLSKLRLLVVSQHLHSILLACR